MDKRFFLALTGLVILIGVSFWTSSVFTEDKVSNETLKDIVQKRSLWEKQIRQFGAQKVWADLTREYATNYNRHAVGHIYGELLYDIYGNGGLKYCDTGFSYGCFHSFFGRVLSEQGTDAIGELDKVCIEKFGPVDSGCQHGIGHGILQYLGPTKLVESLSLCSKISVDGDSCLTGIFMEYNFPAEVSGLEIEEKIRDFKEEDPYYPCSGVPESFKKSCYYELPRYWERVLSSDFEYIGQLCQGVSETIEIKNGCFEGVGEVVSLSTDHSVEETIVRCRQMPDINAEETCRVAASWGFYSLPEYRDDAPKVCVGLRKEVSEKCAR